MASPNVLERKSTRLLSNENSARSPNPVSFRMCGGRFWSGGTAISLPCWPRLVVLLALSYHFLTQPLPTPLAWYAAQMPAGLLAFVTGAMFFIELVLPFFVFAPRRLQFVAAFAFLLLQVCILINGNYNWFNFQTMLLCLPLFDDAALRKILPARLAELKPKSATPRRAVRIVVNVLALLIVVCSLVRMDQRFGGSSAPAWARSVNGWINPLNVVSGYGLFAIMTTTRREIVIEGSYDGAEWHEYEFRYKPGDVMRAPPWNIPHQPRLDWQMWFAALGNPQRLSWFWRFVERLLENEPTVTALLEKNPFAGKPPLYVRAQFYDYTFAGSEQGAMGQWWNRRLLGKSFPMVHLKVPVNRAN